MRNVSSLSRRRSLVEIFALLLTILGSHSLAQTAGTASIQGTISDPTGAVISGAKVTAINTATQVSKTTTSGGNGLYSFPNLSIGTYSLEVQDSGFSTYTQTNIVLEVGSSIAVNVAMAVGETSQHVEVQSAGLALQTEDASFKQTIDEKTVTELPLNGRQVTSLITLSGAAANAPVGNVGGNKTFYSSVVVSIAGGQGNETDYRLDGGDNNDYLTNINLPFPFPDAVNQFSVESTALGAQSGLHPGGLVNVVTRSGTNSWHGSAFEFVRNNLINATNFFSTSKDTLHQNQYGGTFGGKIIPNRIFFFAGYQHLKLDQATANTQVFVPTAANLNGDFSVTDGAGCLTGGAAQLLNPKTGAILPGNKISPLTFDPAALALQKLLPATTSPCGTVNFSIPFLQDENQFVTRIDATLTQRNSLYGRYFLDGYQNPAYYSPTNVLLTTSPGIYARVQSLTVGETFVINANTVNAFHATATRRRINRGSAATGINASSLGINIFAPVPIGIQLTLTNKWGIYCGTCAPGDFNVNAFSVSDDLNMSRGKQQIAFGGEFARAQFNSFNAFTSNGNFSFSGTYSQKGPNGTSTGGTGTDANLDFLTGSMSGFSQSLPQENAFRAPIPSLYFEDVYHPTKRLVLSAGVRWSPEFFAVDVFNRGSIFSMSSLIAGTHSKVYPTAPAGSFYYGDPGVPRAFTQNSPWQFSPRLGATFDPTGTGASVFRAGAAMVYDETDFWTSGSVTQNPPFATSTTNTPVGQPLSLSNPWSSGTVTTNPYPQVYPPTAANAVFPNGGSFVVMDPNFHPAFSYQWTLSMQQQLGRGWQMQLDYIGNTSRHNPYTYPLNSAVYIPGTCSGKPCSSTGNQASRFALTLANPVDGPKYAGGGGTLYITSGANASYNGLVATIQHRMSSTFSFLANYTWSHCIDVVDAQGNYGATTLENPQNIKQDRGNCGFDYRNMFNSSIVAGSHFGVNGWRGELVNNWQLAPIFRITSGAPLTITSGIDNSLTDNGHDRPNLVTPSGIYTGQKITQTIAGNRLYLNGAAFTQNATGTFGNTGRNQFRGPKYLQFDAALSRSFPLPEKLRLDFRLEAFNVLNHPNFSNPNGALNSPTFGQISSSGAARIFQGAVKVLF
jgi:Carboxypeptidase regulatory-like domain